MDNKILMQLAELLDAENPLTGEDELASLSSWDSVAILGAISMAEERGVNLAPEDFANAKTVADVVALIEGQGGDK